MRFKAKKDSQSIERLGRCIQELEARTEAEVVLVIRHSSGVYRDVDYLCGLLLAFAVLLFNFFSPWEFDPISIPLPLILVFIAGARLSHFAGRYGPRRYLTTSKRRMMQVHRAAAASFFDKHIDQIPSRTGILLYFSALEQRAELFPDEKARLALGEHLEDWRVRLQTACESSGTVKGSVEKIAEFLRSFGLLLGQVLPACSEHTNVLGDTPDLDETDE